MLRSCSSAAIWYHFAVVKNSGTLTYYINGVSIGSTSDSTNITYTSQLWIGRINSTAGGGTITQEVQGYLSDIRIIKGTPLYTSNFTPPTSPLGTSVSGTSILTCNDAPDVFDASKGNRVTLGGTAKSSTAQKKNASSSMLFDGNSDYVELANYDEYAVGTDNFVVEFWMRYTGGSGARIIVDTRGQADGYSIRLDGSNKISIYSEPSSSIKHTSASALTQDQWYHVAFVRNDGSSYLFIDGTQSGSTATNTDNYTSTSMVIGAQHAKNIQYFPGYVEDVRFSKNFTRYPFITPRTTLTSSNQANTKLIACHASTATTDGAGLQTITANGTPLVNQAGPHAGMLSVYFDGSDEALRTSDNSSLSMGTGDFTIEAWIKPDNTTTAYRAIVSDNIYGQTSGSFCIYQYGTRLQISANTGSGGSGINTLGASGNTLLSAGTWSHIAFTRASGTARLFHNGIQVGSDTSLTTDFTDDQILIGANNHAGGYPNYDFIGYISNVRVIKGTAIYNKSFTPPTNELSG